jgi:hypothetical protein
MKLACGAFVDRRKSVITLAPSGTAKTHVALGLAACQKSLKVRTLRSAIKWSF